MGRVVLGQIKSSNRPLTCPQTGPSNRCLEETVSAWQTGSEIPRSIFPACSKISQGISRERQDFRSKALPGPLFQGFVESPFERLINFVSCCNESHSGCHLQCSFCAANASFQFISLFHSFFSLFHFISCPLALAWREAVPNLSQRQRVEGGPIPKLPILAQPFKHHRAFWKKKSSKQTCVFKDSKESCWDLRCSSWGGRSGVWIQPEQALI